LSQDSWSPDLDLIRKVEFPFVRTRYGLAPWLEAASSVPSYPRFRGNRNADIVIIGAGLTGCAIAYAAAAAGFGTLVLEAERVGQGATSRSGGVLSPEPGPSFRNVAAAHGLRNARRVFDAWRRGALEGAAVLRRLRINCQLMPRETLVIARGDEERNLRREFEARRDAGLDVSWQTARQISAKMKLDPVAGMKIRDGSTLDPYKACVGLAAAAARAGADICEQSAVKKVRFTRRYADVITAHGTIRTRHVVVATGSATAEFKPLRRPFKRRDSYLAMTEPVPAGVRRQLGDPHVVLSDASTPPYRVRWAPGDRLLIGGADQDETPPRTRSAVLLQRTGQLMYQLLTMYPAISGQKPEFGWEVAYGVPADGLMYIGAHRNYPHHHFAVGGSGSLAGAFVASRILLREFQGKAEKADEVFGWNR
jgi:glycine/D-amino acid oxidase-like deaminating enzyme